MRLLHTTTMVFAFCATLGQVNAADMNYPNGYGQNGNGGYGSGGYGSGGYGSGGYGAGGSGSGGYGAGGSGSGGYGSGGYGSGGYGGQGGSRYMGIRGTKSGDCYQEKSSSFSFFDIFKRKRSNNFSLNCQDYNGAGGYAGHGAHGHAGNGAHIAVGGSGHGSAHNSGNGSVSGAHSHGSAHGSAHGAGGAAGSGVGGSASHDAAGNATNGHVHNGHAGGAHSHGSAHGSAHGAGGRAGYGVGGSANHDANGNATDGHVHNGHAGGGHAGGGHAGGGHAGGMRGSIGAGGYGGFGSGGSGGYAGGGAGGYGGFGSGGSGGYGGYAGGGAGGHGGYGSGGGAGGYGSGWYLRGDVGYASLDISRIEKQVSYIDSITNDIVYAGGNFYSADLDSSWSIGGGFGYQVSSMFRVDATFNHILDVDFTGDSSTSGSGYSCDLIDGQADNDGDTCTSVDTATFAASIGLANAYLDLGNFAGFTPYVGGGIGGGYVHWSNMNNDTRCDATGSDCASTAGLSYETEFDGIHPNKSGWRFAYAAHAGASYSLTSNMKIDAGYSFTNISGGDMFGFASGAGVQGRHGDIQVHEVKAGIRYSFN